MGLEVLLVGPIPTPALPMLVGTLRADVGVMITASHNTFEDNGLKIFNNEGYKISNELEEKIESYVINDQEYAKLNNKNIITGITKRLEDAIQNKVALVESKLSTELFNLKSYILQKENEKNEQIAALKSQLDDKDSLIQKLEDKVIVQMQVDNSK